MHIALHMTKIQTESSKYAPYLLLLLMVCFFRSVNSGRGGDGDGIFQHVLEFIHLDYNVCDAFIFSDYSSFHAWIS